MTTLLLLIRKGWIVSHWNGIGVQICNQIQLGCFGFDVKNLTRYWSLGTDGELETLIS